VLYAALQVKRTKVGVKCTKMGDGVVGFHKRKKRTGQEKNISNYGYGFTHEAARSLKKLG